MNMSILFVLLNVSAVLCLAATRGTPEDELAIRQVIADRAAAFNSHEANLNPMGFSDDFDVVIPPGPYFRGKPDLREQFSTVLRNARMIETVGRIRFIRPEVALADGTFEITGTEIKPYPKGLQTWVLVKENERWVITAIRQMVPVASTGATAPKR
jgi:uncharacterized protein (TIGR02246 family)